jgi:hypothetical protein
LDEEQDREVAAAAAAAAHQYHPPHMNLDAMLPGLGLHNSNYSNPSPRAAVLEHYKSSHAKKARKKEKERTSEKKVCKVNGCTDARVDGKYCRAHSGPAPMNPNARKMMFSH